MAESIVFDPNVRINNITITTLPNSIKYTSGLGESSVMAQSDGNGVVSTVYSENVETKIAEFLLLTVRRTSSTMLLATFSLGVFLSEEE